MEPITEANQRAFRMPFSTEEGRRVAWVVYEHRADVPEDGARWRLGNSARRRVPSREDFRPASEAMHGLRALVAPPVDVPWGWRDPDLYWGALPGDGRFVGVHCDGAPAAQPGTCKLMVDWGGRPLTVTFERRELGRWPEIAAAALALMDRLALGGEGKTDTAGR